MRSARPSGVRYRPQANAGTINSASKVIGVCAPRTGIGNQPIAAKGWIVGGLSTLGKLTRYAKLARLVASSVMPRPETC